MVKVYNSTAYLLGLPQINTVYELSDVINLTEQTLYHLSFKSHKFYRVLFKEKKDGSVRELANPSKELKAVQSWILRNILELIPLHESATGFRKGYGIINNIERHVGNTYFLCMDLEDFFPSISRKYVYNLFRTLGYNQHVSLVFTNLCTYNGGLPQGAVTSPALSNLLNIRLDRRIAGYASKKNLTYTRYADDITLSSRNPGKLVFAGKVLEKIINDEGYTINPMKTRILRPGSQRKVTGLIYSDDQNIGVGKRVKNSIRGKIFNLECMTISKDDYSQKLAHINGWFSFLKGTDRVAYDQLNEYWNRLKQKKALFHEIHDYYQEVSAFMEDE